MRTITGKRKSVSERYAFSEAYRSDTVSTAQRGCAVSAGHGSSATVTGQDSIALCSSCHSTVYAMSPSSVAVTNGQRCAMACGVKGSVLVFIERDKRTHFVTKVHSAHVDGIKIKAGVKYCLENGEIIEVDYGENN